MTTAMFTAHSHSAPQPEDAVAAPAKAPRPRRANPLASTRVQSVLLLVTLLGSWEAAVRFFKVPKHLVPPVSDIGVALWRGLATGPMAKDGFWYHGGVTLAEILLGFFAGGGIGLAIGIVVSQMPKLEALLEPYVAALQSVPKVAVAPIIVVWLGFGISSKVVIICLLTFFPVLVTSIAGFKAVDPDRIDLLRSLSRHAVADLPQGQVPERAALHLRGSEHGRRVQRGGRGGRRVRRCAGGPGRADPADGGAGRHRRQLRGVRRALGDRHRAHRPAAPRAAAGTALDAGRCLAAHRERLKPPSCGGRFQPCSLVFFASGRRSAGKEWTMLTAT